MKNYKILSAFCISAILLANCSSVKEGFTSNRKNNSDEFLVKKKAPLVMPPEFGELPNPKIKKSAPMIMMERWVLFLDSGGWFWVVAVAM